MAIEFYYMAPSPPCRAVWMILKVLNLEFVSNIIDLVKGDQKKTEFMAINPRGKIPALKDGEYCIAESRAISTYLCNQYEKGDDSTRLYPVDPKARGKVDQMLYVSENVESVIRVFVNTRGVIFQGQKPCLEKLEEVHKTLQSYEEYLDKNEFMAGDHLTLADFFMLSPMQTLEVPEIVDLSKYTKTTNWLNKMKNLPYYKECNEDGMKIFNTSYRKALAKTNNQQS